jgi:hypothetical protein
MGPAVVRARYTWDAIVPMLIEKYRALLALSPTRHIA